MTFVRFGVLTGPVVYLAQVIGQNTHRRTWRQASEVCPLCQFTVRQGTRLVHWCIAVSIELLLILTSCLS
jgi:hypothetical protein